MDVSVRDRLTSRLATVDANIETVDPGLCGKLPAEPVNEREQVRPLVKRESLEPLDVPPRDHERVAVADRKRVTKGERDAGS